MSGAIHVSAGTLFAHRRCAGRCGFSFHVSSWPSTPTGSLQWTHGAVLAITPALGLWCFPRPRPHLADLALRLHAQHCLCELERRRPQHPHGPTVGALASRCRFVDVIRRAAGLTVNVDDVFHFISALNSAGLSWTSAASVCSSVRTSRSDHSRLYISDMACRVS